MAEKSKLDRWSFEPDDAFAPELNRWRITDSARKRRKEQKCSARPQYIATVYSRDDAQLIVTQHNTMPALVDKLAELEKLQNESIEAMTGRLRELALEEYKKAFVTLMTYVDRDGGHAQTGDVKIDLDRGIETVARMNGLVDALQKEIAETRKREVFARSVAEERVGRGLKYKLEAAEKVIAELKEDLAMWQSDKPVPRKLLHAKMIEVKGRGKIICVDTRDYFGWVPPKIGEIVEFEGKEYEVRGVEMTRGAAAVGPGIGLLIKENKEDD